MSDKQAAALFGGGESSSEEEEESSEESSGEQENQQPAVRRGRLKCSTPQAGWVPFTVNIHMQVAVEGAEGGREESSSSSSSGGDLPCCNKKTC